MISESCSALNFERRKGVVMRMWSRVGRSNVSLSALLPLVLASGVAFAQAPGSISGTLAGDDGKPLAALVTAFAIPPVHPSSSAKSGTNGAFTIGNLAPGTYQLCAETGAAGYLDPCAWEPIPPTTQIAAGQVLAGYRLTAKKGTPLQVRVIDAAGLLTASPSLPAGKGPSLVLGVFTTNSLFHLLATTGKDAAGIHQQVTVPQNASVRLHISGQGLQIANSSGSAVNSGVTTITTGAGPLPPIIYTVSPKP
jgi:hypothetical protein